MITDLRSDTFTKPSEEMLKAMFAAPVGDDVFGAAFHPELMGMIWDKYQKNLEHFK